MHFSNDNRLLGGEVVWAMNTSYRIAPCVVCGELTDVTCVYCYVDRQRRVMVCNKAEC